MAPAKTIRTRIRQALAKVDHRRRLMIVEMPEEMETAPHWLLWVALLALLGFVLATGWQTLASDSQLQVYLPFI